MYFALPKSNERPSTKKTQLSNTMADDRISEIIHNLDDHWGSPPILTPNTLTHILSNQWEDTAIFTLIEEMIKTLESIKTESLANDIKNDPIIQKYMISKRQGQQGEQSQDVVLQHLIELLQHHNKMHTS
ncbi:hypothetical protein CU098_013224 [Rhizopus stolonifer]|uniref:Uncharacterized protein n=1 Tax=Rhizopus stolonifer TaxID=4846 RepID=A0A367KX07_RHIST|nr:hypothetical protein CU098_013224 [Rhizopus stolonifer]